MVDKEKLKKISEMLKKQASEPVSDKKYIDLAELKRLVSRDR